MQLQGVEVSKATAPFTVTVPGKQASSQSGPRRRDPAPADRRFRNRRSRQTDAKDSAPSRRRGRSRPGRTSSAWTSRTRRIADALLDYQYWAPDDPQRSPYDDTGWTFGELFNVKVVRVTDVKVLDVPVEPVSGELSAAGGVTGHRHACSRSTTTRIRRWRRCATGFKDATIDVAEEAFEAAGQTFARGSFVIKGVSPATWRRPRPVSV